MTKNEILYSLNKPDDFILAIVEFLDDDTHRVHYVRQPFQREPDFGVTSVNYDFAELLARRRSRHEPGAQEDWRRPLPRRASPRAPVPGRAFDEVLATDRRRAGAGPRGRQHGADRPLLEHWRVHQPRRSPTTAGARGPSRPWPSTSTGASRTMSGFSASNLWRMMQFFETYRDQPKLAPLVRELSWTHNLAHHEPVPSATRSESSTCGSAIRERGPIRELQRQLDGALFERDGPVAGKTVTSGDRIASRRRGDLQGHLPRRVPRPSAQALRGRPAAGPGRATQAVPDRAGPRLLLVGSEYPIQVGGRDFALDLLFFNRALNCLVAFELKIVEFEPEHLGKLEFYLEALDRDVKKPHERPSIGVLLCATKNHEVVEYALSRSMSPALVAEYQTRLPDKKLLAGQAPRVLRAGASPGRSRRPRRGIATARGKNARRHEEAKGPQDVMTATYRKRSETSCS